MVLNKRLINVPFAKGINEKASSHYLPVGELSDLRNGVFSKGGEITKRGGYSSSDLLITDQGNLTTSFPFRDSIYLGYAKNKLYRLGNALSAAKFGAINDVGFYSAFSTEIFSGSSGNSLHHEEAPSIAIFGDYICVAYLKVDYDYTNRAKNYSHVVNLIEREGMTVVATSEARTGSAAQYTYQGKIKVVSAGAHSSSNGCFNVYYEYKNGSNYELRRDHLSIGSSSVTMPSLAGNGVVIGSSTNDYNQTTSQQWFDVLHADSDDIDGIVVVYYKNNSGAHSVRYVIDSDPDGSFSPVNSTDISDGLGSTAPATRLVLGHSTAGTSLSSTVSKYYIAYRTGTTVRLSSVDINPSTGANHSNFTNSSTYFQPHGFVDHRPLYDGSIDSVALMFEDGPNENSTTQSIYRITRPTSGPSVSISSALSLGRGRSSVQGFQYQNTTNNFVTVFGGSNAYSSNKELSTVSFHVDTNNSSGTIVGRSLTQSYRPEYSPFGPCKVVGYASSGDTPEEFYTAVPRTTNINTFPTSATEVEAVPNSIIEIIKITTGVPSYGTRHSAVGDNVFFTFGNAMYQDDGGNIVSLSGLPKPEITSVAVSGTSGSMTSNKTYKYKIVFEREDVNGNLYRSEPSDPVSVAMSSNDSTVITFEQIGMMVKHDDYYVSIYRTQADGNLYNKVATVSGQSDYSGGTSTFADTFSDAVVAVGASLYTDANELADVIVPACFYVKEHRNRIFAITEDNRILFSKEYVEGFGVSFSDSFFIPLDGSLDDKPTALGSAGGDLYIFREKSIYVISGDGPSKSGSGSYFTPRLISNSIGAIKGSPTLNTDSGLYFQSIKGIYRIFQGQVEFIGAMVEDTVGFSQSQAYASSERLDDNIVKEIIQNQPTSTIRFLLNKKVMAYNSFFNQWSHYEYSTLSSLETFSGMFSIENIVYMTTSGNDLWGERSDIKTLNQSAFMPLKIKTGWIHLNEIQGFARAYKFALLGKIVGSEDFNLNIYVYYDYHDIAPVDIFKLEFDPAAEGSFQLRGHLTRQKCQSLKFEIFDSDSNSTLSALQGFTLSSLVIETGGKKGIYRMANTEDKFNQSLPNSQINSIDESVYNLTRTIGDSSAGVVR